MDRRAALRILGGTTAAVTTTDLEALGRALHRRLRHAASLRVLDPHQNETVVVLSDLILPVTDTPGAKAASVNQFIDLLLAEWYDPEDRDRLLAGLADLDARARAVWGDSFVGGTAEQQSALLVRLDDEAAVWQAAPDSSRGPEPFYRQMKWLTLFGYYTSEIGAVREEHYQIVPGRYLPCAPVDSTAGPE